MAPKPQPQQIPANATPTGMPASSSRVIAARSIGPLIEFHPDVKQPGNEVNFGGLHGLDSGYGGNSLRPSHLRL